MAASASSRATPKKVEHVSWLFTLGSIFSMFGGPLFILWCFVCLETNKGSMILPEALTVDALKNFFVFLLGEIHRIAYPSAKAVTVYLSWVALQAVFFHFGPGPVGKGKVLEDGKTRLSYKYNGQFAWFSTLAIVAGLHLSGVFTLSELFALYGPMITVTNLFTAVLIAVLLVWAAVANKWDRQSDSIVYDYFMGPMLNPRIGSFDIKFFFELRPGIMNWFFNTVAIAYKMYEENGTISKPMILIIYMHLCFVNACYKGESSVVQTMDIVYEKFGWMLCWLDLCVVPFIFSFQPYYLYKMGLAFDYALPIAIGLGLLHTFAYWMFDTANSQKDYFREDPKEWIEKGFPQLYWGKLENPKYMQTKRGTKLLIDGWWKYARHLNYVGDMLLAWTWGVTCGFGSVFPYVYAACYLTPLLIHRERRDNRDCAAKYGKDWEEYCKIVPYRMIPYVY